MFIVIYIFKRHRHNCQQARRTIICPLQNRMSL